MSVTVTIPDRCHNKSLQVKSSAYILSVLGRNSELKNTEQQNIIRFDTISFWLTSTMCMT